MICPHDPFILNTGKLHYSFSLSICSNDMDMKKIASKTSRMPFHLLIIHKQLNSFFLKLSREETKFTCAEEQDDGFPKAGNPENCLVDDI